MSPLHFLKPSRWEWVKRWSASQSKPPLERISTTLSLRFAVILSLGVVGAIMVAVNRYRHGDGPVGWRTVRDLPPLTVIDTGVVTWSGSDSEPAFPAGRITVRAVPKGSFLRERMLAPKEVSARQGVLLALDVDTLLSLIAGDTVFLVAWTEEGDSIRQLGRAQVVTTARGRATLVLPTDAGGLAVMYHKAERLAVVALPRHLKLMPSAPPARSRSQAPATEPPKPQVPDTGDGKNRPKNPG